MNDGGPPPLDVGERRGLGLSVECVVSLHLEKGTIHP